MPFETHDASAGMFASIDRKIRREDAIREALRSVFEDAGEPLVDIDDVDAYLDQATTQLIDQLAAIDRR